jgi:hypothetical protein
LETKSRGPKEWTKFDFSVSCVLDTSDQDFLKRSAAGSPGGGCCPYYFCLSGKQGAPCGLKTAETCAERCEEFYEKYIKEEEK